MSAGEQLDTNLRAFVMAAMALDGVSVAIEDDGQRVVATCSEHDYARKIDAEPIHEAAREHGVRVTSSRSDFERREHVVEVVR